MSLAPHLHVASGVLLGKDDRRGGGKGRGVVGGVEGNKGVWKGRSGGCSRGLAVGAIYKRLVLHTKKT